MNISLWDWSKRGRNRDPMARYVTIRILYTLLDAAIHQIPMNEQGRTHDGDFIRGALQRWSKLAKRAKDEERDERRGRKVSERRGKRKRGTRVGRRRDTGKMYAHAHASVAERSRIVLLFNSDRVIDLARLSCAWTYMYIHMSAKYICGHDSSRWRKRVRKYSPGWEWDGEGKYRLMTLIWEVGTSLRVIFIIHAMSRQCTAAVEWPMPHGWTRDSDLAEPISINATLSLRDELDFLSSESTTDFESVLCFIWTQSVSRMRRTWKRQVVMNQQWVVNWGPKILIKNENAKTLEINFFDEDPNM